MRKCFNDSSVKLRRRYISQGKKEKRRRQKKRKKEGKKEREREGKSYFLEKFIGDLSSCRQEKKHKNVHLKKKLDLKLIDTKLSRFNLYVHH